MLFRSAYRRRLYNQQLTGADQNWNDLREWLGLTGDELSIRGEKSLKETTVYVCVKILSETLGKLPLKIYKSDENGQRKPVNHYLLFLMKVRPNPYMSAFTFWSCLETQRNLYGNTYAWMDINRKNGRIQGFYPLDSRRMQIYVDDVGLLSSEQSVWYVYTDNLGNQYKIDPDEILHFKGLTTNGLVGLSVIEQLKNTIENSNASAQFLNNSYKRGMSVSGVLQYVGDLDEEGRRKTREKFEHMATGLINANRIAVMPLGMQFQPLQLKMTDAQFLENTRFTVQQLTAAFGIKPHQVNDMTKSSYASVSESNREFYTDTIMAILTNYEQEITYKVFLPSEQQSDLYVKFNADVILRGDIEKRYAMYKDAVQNMLKTPNECRALEEDPPMDGGDILYGNAALAPATLLAEGIAFQKKGGEKNGN
ncbi:phage portal protein [Caproiciproducens galactitolivorans]|uniref:Phage portal protein n=1 Tax=Caproiciproducens galactitolivorans TaxID=642589 RepID=A0A4Z0YEE2_9FIRM|nr:phage portal protein [Caproiciproducens galactitolivorans]QEY34623.1 phage portal protein [Caproiciproducens galactitolivorans]TGJ75412.1 phage portal protein [Caproiciproducens galactitolivorans]